MIKALIFDFDGLIMDTESPEVDGWKVIYAEYGQEFPLQAWANTVVGATAANLDPAAHLAAITGQDLDQAALHKRARDYRLQEQSRLSALPGVTDYLKDARRLGLGLAVASSSSRAWVHGYLNQLGLAENFDAIVCREEVSQVKPSPELFLKAVAALGLRPGDVLVFEDSPNGVLAARRAGMRVVAVPNPITALGRNEGADLQLGSLAEMPLERLLDWFELEIRPETAADIPAIRRVEQQAFGRAAEANLVDLCRQRGHVSLSLVGVRSGQVVGHILFTPLTLEPRPDGLNGLGLGPIAVLPQYQRGGIGARLIQSGLELCRAQAVDFVVLLGDPGYYGRFGFRPGREYGLTSEYGDGEAFQALELKPGALKGLSGLVKYVPEFKELEL